MADLRIGELLRISAEALRKKGVENPRLNAEQLLADVLKTQRINLYLEFEKPLTENEINSYREKIKRRLNREPLQYILGYCEFYGMKFSVTPDVLIPRPETELLVDEGIKELNRQAEACLTNRESNKSRVLEIGTGSGCISIAIAKNCDCEIEAIDVSEKALGAARSNAELYELKARLEFQRKDIFKDFENFEGYDLIISNPPYIASEELESLQDEIKLYEPRAALTDGGDGLSYYRRIIELAKKTRSKDDKLKLVLLEIGDGKKEAVEKLLVENSIVNYSFVKDLMGIFRVLKFEVN